MPNCGSLSRHFAIPVTRIVFGTASLDGGGRIAAVGQGLPSSRESVTVEVTKKTLAKHVVELHYAPPTEEGAPMMLTVWVDGECRQAGLQIGDAYGLAMELIDDDSVLPPWNHEAPDE